MSPYGIIDNRNEKLVNPINRIPSSSEAARLRSREPAASNPKDFEGSPHALEVVVTGQ
jgi:hypothetical protein